MIPHAYGMPYLPYTDSLYIKHRVLRILERMFPSAHIEVEITDDWERFGPFLRVYITERGDTVGASERIDLGPYFSKDHSENYLRILTLHITRRVVEWRGKDAWQT